MCNISSGHFLFILLIPFSSNLTKRKSINFQLPSNRFDCAFSLFLVTRNERSFFRVTATDQVDNRFGCNFSRHAQPVAWISWQPRRRMRSWWSIWRASRRWTRIQILQWDFFVAYAWTWIAWLWRSRVRTIFWAVARLRTGWSINRCTCWFWWASTTLRWWRFAMN